MRLVPVELLQELLHYLKKIQGSKAKIVLADPQGSVLYSYITSGHQKMERSDGSSVTEGIGQGRCTENLRFGLDCIDDAILVKDKDAISMTYRLLFEEGLLVGTSSGLNVCAAVQTGQAMVKKSGGGFRDDINIVSLVCDSGSRYANRLFNREWLETKGFL